MNQSWKDYEKAAESGPLPLFWKALGGLLVIGVVLWLVGSACGLIGETAQVAKEQFGPRATLVKYEWFKDAAAQLDKKRADIVLYEGRMKRCAAVTHADER